MSQKQKKIEQFQPDNVGQLNGNLFGLPFTYEESRIAILPVPWDVTVSYGEGTSEGPGAILAASPQLDFHDPDFNDAWKVGFYLSEISKEWKQINADLRSQSVEYISFLENGGEISQNPEMQKILASINEACFQLKSRVKERILDFHKDGKIPALLGGDHSTPLGIIEAMATLNDEFGMLVIDAHADLRNAYEGFEFSHASIMYNALKIPQVKKIVQVGIRDICKSESDLVDQLNGRVKIFYDREIKNAIYTGKNWIDLCKAIIAELPDKVYISFDIDGLDPKLCPNTGTPVPGGLEFEQALFLFRELIDSGKKIIAFDLNEVSPGNDEWDANVGARMLWKLCVFLAKSNKLSI